MISRLNSPWRRIANRFLGVVLALGCLGLNGSFAHAENADRCEALNTPRLSVAELRAGLARHRQALERAFTLPANYLNGYYDRRIEPRLATTRYAEVKNPEVLYRGMYLTVDELASVLSTGFEVARNTWSAVGGKGVYFTSHVREAATYIFHNGNEKGKGLGVVFKVRKKPGMTVVVDAESNPTNTIFKSSEDVPAAEITEVLVWGQYGLERLGDVFERAEKGNLVPHTEWTGQFDGSF